MSTARTRSVQRREEAASDAKERRNHQNLLSKWRAKVQSGETQPVVWQPGVSLDLEATQRTFDVVYGGKVLLVELAAHDERTIDVDALLGAHAAVVLHDNHTARTKPEINAAESGEVPARGGHPRRYPLAIACMVRCTLSD